MVVCLAGRSEAKKDETYIKVSGPNIFDNTGLISYRFVEKGIADIIIEKIDGTILTIPFSEIVKALEAL